MINRSLLALTFGLLPMAAVAQAPPPASDEAPRLEVAAARKMIEAGKAMMIDTRDADAYARGHIPGSRSVPVDDVGTKVAELKKMGTVIIAYCG
jgi:3-mercaptopyruvate sulfurtransferase SseA